MRLIINSRLAFGICAWKTSFIVAFDQYQTYYTCLRCHVGCMLAFSEERLAEVESLIARGHYGVTFI